MPQLSAEAAADLHWAMVQDTWAMAVSLPDVHPVLFIDERWDGLDDLVEHHTPVIQASGDLGVRMYMCFEHLRGAEFMQQIIIGTDSPTLPAGFVLSGFEQLKSPEDAVLGPAEDGGYYLVGCCRPRQGMFADVAWSTDRTLAETREAFDRVGFQTHFTEPWNDVDTFADVQKLNDEVVGPAVAAWMEAHRDVIRAGK